jgi:hypothetical protein
MNALITEDERFLRIAPRLLPSTSALGHYHNPLGLIERAHHLLCWTTRQYRL